MSLQYWKIAKRNVGMSDGKKLESTETGWPLAE
jgi:hypothetical protein